MVKWTAELNQLLLVLVTHTQNITVDAAKIHDAWPEGTPGGKPSLRAIKDQLGHIRKQTQEKYRVAAGSGKMRITGALPVSTAAKSASATSRTPVSSTKRKQRHPLSSDEEDSGNERLVKSARKEKEAFFEDRETSDAEDQAEVGSSGIRMEIDLASSAVAARNGDEDESAAIPPPFSSEASLVQAFDGIEETSFIPHESSKKAIVKPVSKSAPARKTDKNKTNVFIARLNGLELGTSGKKANVCDPYSQVEGEEFKISRTAIAGIFDASGDLTPSKGAVKSYGTKRERVAANLKARRSVTQRAASDDEYMLESSDDEWDPLLEA